jgi:hypothetical protein
MKNTPAEVLEVGVQKALDVLKLGFTVAFYDVSVLVVAFRKNLLIINQIRQIFG